MRRTRVGECERHTRRRRLIGEGKCDRLRPPVRGSKRPDAQPRIELRDLQKPEDQQREPVRRFDELAEPLEERRRHRCHLGGTGERLAEDAHQLLGLAGRLLRRGPCHVDQQLDERRGRRGGGHGCQCQNSSMTLATPVASIAGVLGLRDAALPEAVGEGVHDTRAIMRRACGAGQPLGETVHPSARHSAIPARCGLFAPDSCQHVTKHQPYRPEVHAARLHPRDVRLRRGACITQSRPRAAIGHHWAGTRGQRPLRNVEPRGRGWVRTTTLACEARVRVAAFGSRVQRPNLILR